MNLLKNRMLIKYFALLLMLAQCLLTAPTPSADGITTTLKPSDLTQEQLELEAHNETINLLNALFRAQIAYFSGVRGKLTPSTKRARDIELYVFRLTAAIAEQELDKKDAMWLDIFDEFSKSPLLVNRQEDTGLTNAEYQALLTDKKLQDITKSFFRDVSIYFLKMAKLGGKVVEMSIDEYIEQEIKRHP